MANEKRLIDLDLAIERAKESDKIVKSSIWETSEVVEFLEDCPIEDAVEVVHGRWECTYDEKTGETDVTCSHCKDTRTINGCYVTSAGESCYFDDNYCPNCGAKMDGDGND